jgi:8-oxo-dGTP pyrophosphatase MutT (NUDIX family)
MTSVCDHQCVGVLVNDDDGRLLLFRRKTEPWGVAPVAGHVDDHGTPTEAARAETSEEVGLSVPVLSPLGDRDGLWLPNRCRRTPGGQPVGHRWWLYSASVPGGSRTPIAANREQSGAGWHLKHQIEALATRTVAYAVGDVTEREFRADPGLEPVWVLLLYRLGHLQPLTQPLVETVAELCLVPTPAR